MYPLAYEIGFELEISFKKKKGNLILKGGGKTVLDSKRSET